MGGIDQRLIAAQHLEQLLSCLEPEYRDLLPYLPSLDLAGGMGNTEAETDMDTLHVRLNRELLLMESPEEKVRLRAVFQHELAHAREWLLLYKEHREVEEGARLPQDTYYERKKAIQDPAPKVAQVRYGEYQFFLWEDTLPEELRVLLAEERLLSEKEFERVKLLLPEDARGVRDGYMRPYAALRTDLMLFNGKIEIADFPLEETTTLVDAYYEHPEEFTTRYLDARGADGKYVYPLLRAKVALMREYGFLPPEQ